MSDVYNWKEAPKAQFAVLGDPVAHSLSPQMHMAAFKALNLPYRYVAIRVPLAELHKALDHLAGIGYVGVNLTLPLKESGAEWISNPDPFVAQVGAVNTIRLAGKSGVNTDAPAFLDTLEDLKVHPDTDVLLLGAGGSARALAVALAEAEYRVKIFNRTRSKAEEIAKLAPKRIKVLKEPDPTGVSLVVNATSVSLSGEDLPIDWKKADRKTVAYDLAYGPEMPQFLLNAALAGLKVMDGVEMLVRQGGRSLEWWLGGRAPLEEMRSAVR